MSGSNFENAIEKNYHIIKIKETEYDFFSNFLISHNIPISFLDKEHGVVLLNKSYTGVINTSEQTISLHPKFNEININHVIRMYYYVYGYSNSFDNPQLGISSDNTTESIYKKYLSLLERVLKKGLIVEYKNNKVLSDSLRGRVNFSASYKNILLYKKNPIVKTIGVLSRDIFINRILFKALNIVSQSDNYRHQANSLKRFFGEIEDLYDFNLDLDINFTRRNNYYHDAYLYARLIIENSYVGGMGENFGENFIIDFDKLFEAFIHKILEKNSGDPRFISWKENKIFTQPNSQYIRKYMPDILFNYNPSDESNNCLPSAEAIIDVKNKSNIFKNADIFQTSIYGELLAASKVILIYPSFVERKNERINLIPAKLRNNIIMAVYINIEEKSGEKFLASIEKFRKKIYSALGK